jgi:hypothetical protein
MTWNLRWLFLSVAAFAAASGLAWLVADQPALAGERSSAPRLESSAAAPAPSTLPPAAPAEETEPAPDAAQEPGAEEPIQLGQEAGRP